MGEHSLGLRKAIDLVTDVRHLVRRHYRFLRIGSWRRTDEADSGLAVEEHFFHEILPRKIVDGASIAHMLRVEARIPYPSSERQQPLFGHRSLSILFRIGRVEM